MGWGDSSPEPAADPSDDALQRHRTNLALYEKRNYGLFGISEGDSWLGYVNIRNLDDMPEGFKASYEVWNPRAGEIEILYGFDPSCWGKGYAKEAVGEVVKWAREEKGMKRLTACVKPENKGSQKVLEACGFKLVEGSLGYSKTGDVYYVLE